MDGPPPMGAANELEKPKEKAEDSAVAPSVAERPKPEDLIARAIAPVKAVYLRPPPVRPCSTNFLPDDGRGNKSANGDGAPATNSVLTQEKKSKRQQKRERQQNQKSVKNLCPEIARTGDVSACRYGGTCRFSHDFDGFIAQKPEDLPGTCPFLDAGNSCPYGITCRFSTSHIVGAVSREENFPSKNLEINVLSKDLQKLLWKNKVNFPKAVSQLKFLGLKGGKGSKRKEDAEQDAEHPVSQNGSAAFQEVNDCESNTSPIDKMQYILNACSKDDRSNDESIVDDLKPHKKPKIPPEQRYNASLSNSELNEVHVPTVIEEGAPNNSCSSRVELIPNINERGKKLIDFRDKLYLAPLTTVGNLPFRRVCKVLGADITCGEMAMCTNLLQGQASEWALLRKHSSEDMFGVQICGAYPDTVARTVELIEKECHVDFIDINMGCPIDIVCNKGAGSSLLTKPARMKGIIQAASSTINKPVTVKVRTGYFEGRNRVDSIIGDIGYWGVSAVTIHGRSRQQRYSKLADWDYIYECAGKSADNIQVLGNGDIFSYEDWNKHRSDCPQLATCMIARGALIKPWLFTEIKEQRHWDISSAERFDILKKFVHFGLEHWGSDNKGVETTRHFLLEWLSYTYRYIPVGVLEVIPQRLNWRPPSYFGRNDLETLMASDSAADWIRISEMLLGKVPDDFTFTPKHKSNAYDRAENG